MYLVPLLKFQSQIRCILKVCEYEYPKAGYVPVIYNVKHGDTFYRIAKHYFNIPLDTLQKWNGLEKTMMFTGMKLHVGYMSLDGIPDSLQAANANPINSLMHAMQREFEYGSLANEPTFQNGAAYWQREKKGIERLLLSAPYCKGWVSGEDQKPDAAKDHLCQSHSAHSR